MNNQNYMIDLLFKPILHVKTVSYAIIMSSFCVLSVSGCESILSIFVYSTLYKVLYKNYKHFTNSFPHY